MFLTTNQLMRRTKLTKWFRIRKVKEQCQYYMHRSWRNRYGIAYTMLRRSLQAQSHSRTLMAHSKYKLRMERLEAACEEHDLSLRKFTLGLKEAGVGLNTHMLSILAIYEPRSFEKLVELSERTQIEKLYRQFEQLPERHFLMDKK